MANVTNILKVTAQQYSTLVNGGTITKSGVTYSFDPNALYLVDAGNLTASVAFNTISTSAASTESGDVVTIHQLPSIPNNSFYVYGYSLSGGILTLGVYGSGGGQTYDVCTPNHTHNVTPSGTVTVNN